jgi:hypothetical protein
MILKCPTGKFSGIRMAGASGNYAAKKFGDICRPPVAVNLRDIFPGKRARSAHEDKQHFVKPTPILLHVTVGEIPITQALDTGVRHLRQDRRGLRPAYPNNSYAARAQRRRNGGNRVTA